MDRLDSRRLTGPNLLLDRPGAVLEVSLSPEAGRGGGRGLGGAGAAHARRGRLERTRRSPPGRSPAARAWRSRLPSTPSTPRRRSTSWAWDAVEAELAGRQAPDFRPTSRPRRRDCGTRSPARRNLALLALRDAAAAHGVSFLVGRPRRLGGARQGLAHLAGPRPPRSGGGRLGPGPRHPRAAGHRDQRQDHDRAPARGHGATPRSRWRGVTSTDRIEVGGEVIERGDFSGPGGARTLLRDRRVEVAILETARGGMLRRGLAVDRADAALVTNIAADHLGEFGILDLAVARRRQAGGHPRRGRRRGGWCSTPTIRSWSPRRRRIARARPLVQPRSRRTRWSGRPWRPAARRPDLQDGELVLARGGERRSRSRGWRTSRSPSAAPPGTTSPTPWRRSAWRRPSASAAEAMAAGLRRVGGSPEDNPGRANLFERDGVRDPPRLRPQPPRSHRPARHRARPSPPSAGCWCSGRPATATTRPSAISPAPPGPFQPDRIVVKELPEMLRGRQPGEVPGHPRGRAAPARHPTRGDRARGLGARRGEKGAGGGPAWGSGGAAGAHPAGGGAGGHPGVGGGRGSCSSTRNGGRLGGGVPESGTTLCLGRPS